MITQNVMLDFLSRAPKVSKELKLDTNQKSDQFAFRNTFERESQRAQLKDRSYGSDRNSYHDRIKENSVKRENVNSYRDIVRKNVNNIKNDSVDNKCKNESNDIEKDEKVETTQDEAVLQVLSEIFGIQPAEFKKLLEEINIDPQQLADETKISEISGKIAIKLGLDTAQTSSLEEILKETLMKVQQALKEADSSLTLTSNDKPILSQTESEDNENTMARLSEMVTKGNTVEEVKANTELISKLKMRIDELTKSLNNDPDSVGNEISNIIKVMVGNEKQLKQSVNQTNEITTNEETSNETQILNQTVKNEKTGSIDQNAQKPNRYEKNSNNEANNKANSEIEDGSNMNTSNKSESANSFTGSDTNSANSSGNGNNLEQKNEILSKHKVNANEKEFSELDTSITINNSEQNNTSKTAGSDIIKHHREVPVGKREILNQIIEKASILQNAEKAEMVLSLKPESLGKLSLKIVTEQGIVTAKFIAESQQVKEVLESNMQLLKDTLEKQGLAVQSFSVSVNQNPEREFSGRGYQGDDQNSKNTGNKILDTKKAGVIEVAESINKVNPYNYGESSINLTA